MTKHIDMNRYADDPAYIDGGHEWLRKKLLEDLAPSLACIKLVRNEILVATYVPPKKQGLLYVTDKSITEERWQGKVGLLIAAGPLAFDFDEAREHMEDLMQPQESEGGVMTEMHEDHARYLTRQYFNLPRIGDWIVYRTSETYEIGIRVEQRAAASCRVIRDDAFMMVLTDPTVIW